MRTNKQLKEIRKDLDNIKVMFADLSDPSLDYIAVINKLAAVKQSLKVIVHRFDLIDKVWAKDRLVNETYRELNLSIDRYNDVRKKVSERFAAAGVDKEIKDVETAFDATDIPYRTAENSSRYLHSYINDVNNGRTGERLVRVASRAGAILGIAGLGGAVFGLVLQNSKLNDNYASLQNDYAIVGKELDEAIAERKEWEDKYNFAVQNGGSGISKDEYDKVVGENETLKSENAELRESYDTLKAEYDGLKLTYDSLLADYNAIMAVIPSGSDAVEYIKGLKSQVDTLNAKVTQLETRIDGLESSLSALRIKVKSLEGQLEAALADGTNKTLIETLQKQLAEANAKYTELETEYKNAIAEHNKTVNDYKSTVASLTTALETEKAKNKELTDKNTELEADNKEINSAYDALITEIGSTYSTVIVGGTEKDPIKQFNAVIDYYCAQAGQSNEVTEFLVKFVAEIKGLPYEQVAKMSPAELVYEAEKIIGMPSAPSENPNGNVHEGGNSGSTGSNGSTGSTEEEKDEQNNGDGTGNISPDLPPVRE